MITIYTDGSARGNPGPGGWGAIVADETRAVELGGFEEHTTNNRMELTAAINALKCLDSLFRIPDSVVLHTDSEYVMKGITIWVHGWQKNNWRTAAKKAVLNQDLWQELLQVTEGRRVEWKYVAGHSGHFANERCDAIATSFADKDALVLYDGPRELYPISL
jgi:ribonuclease HI